MLQIFVQGEAMAYSSDENDLSGLTQKVFANKVPCLNRMCLVLCHIFENQWSNLESLKK